MAVAIITPSSDGSRFEVHSKASSAVPKMIVKSAHRAEIARWLQSLNLNIEYYSTPGKASEAQWNLSSRTTTSSSSSEKAANTVKNLPPIDSFVNPTLSRTATSLSPRATISRASRARDPSPTGTAGTEDDNISIFEATDGGSFMGVADQPNFAHGLPHEATFDMGVINIKTQVDLTRQLVDSLFVPPAAANGSAAPGPSAVVMVKSASRQQAVKNALGESLVTLSRLISQQDIMTQDRERYLLGRIHREVEARRLWEENMLVVAQQQAETDDQLAHAARDNEKKRRALKQARGVLAGIAADSLPNSPATEEPTSSIGDIMRPSGGTAQVAPITPPSLDRIASPGFRASIASPLGRPSIANLQEVHDALAAADMEVSDDGEDEDEFFDAIETNALPNLQIHDMIANPPVRASIEQSGERAAAPSTAKSTSKHGTVVEYLSRDSLEPYSHVRNKLPIDDDKRPSTSCE